MLSYILHRKYLDPLEPALLTGWMPGVNYRDTLFSMQNFTIDADIAADLITDDMMALDSYHAVGDGVHKRTCQQVKVMRFGKIVKVPAFVYIAGPYIQKLQGVSMR